MSNTSNEIEVSNSQLIKQFIYACIVAVILFITIILPAEYQVDPLSTGKLLGLDTISAENSGLDMTPIDIKDDLSTFRLSQSNSLLKTVTREITIEGYEGIEVKATMLKGEGITFIWSTQGGTLYTDMHGELLTDTSQFESYFKEKAITTQQGTFVAPFDGTHGWYWQNMQEENITVTLILSGFFRDLHEKQE